jgi:hypothetical protein
MYRNFIYVEFRGKIVHNNVVWGREGGVRT